MRVKNLIAVLTAIILIPISGIISAQETTPNRPEVNYDSSTDKLSIKAENTSLFRIYQHISLLSGVDIWLDPEVEQNITITLSDQSLEEGLKQIGRKYNLNQALIYASRKNAGGKAEPMVVAAKVLPEGKQSGSGLKQLVGPLREGMMRSEASLDQVQTGTSVRDMAIERWQARMSAMPEEKRKHYEEKINKRIEDKQKREALRAKRKEEHDKKKAEKEAKRLAREEQLKAEDPEKYERIMQRKEERRQKYLEELKESGKVL